jgi:hypothetical protein
MRREVEDKIVAGTQGMYVFSWMLNDAV